MKIVTAANDKFKIYIDVLQRQCDKLKYDLEIYDLGGLGTGIPADVKHNHFQKHGWYHQMHGPWRTKALHKPSIISHALKDEPIAYLDADAFPVARFDEVWDQDFNIGVTERCRDEKDAKVLGPINAGVMFFKPSAKAAVLEWDKLTRIAGNDQRGMCKLLQNPGSGFKFFRFPVRIYNYYRFPETPGPETKIYHFKDDDKVRPCFNSIVSSLETQPHTLPNS